MIRLEYADDGARYGGKAAHLARACAAGLPVPGGFALAWETAHAVAEGAPLAPLEPGVTWAVRSSAIDEDGATTSFAGQHLTRLHVPSGAVASAVAEVVASGRDPGAQGYRARMGLAPAARMGVVLQRLVPVAIAGVMFTRDPLTGEDVLRVEAAWGLGEVVVQGLVIPDGWRLSRDGAVLEAVPGEKDREVALDPGGGTVEREVAGPRVHAPCLGPGHLARLAALARALDGAFDGPHDVEWAFDAHDRLFLLQRRGITAWTR